ncbi:hypothetical protein B5S29_g3414 [[Candida] boidinii]|nr:hypothetical protein B5S29_g3414 [[Candida] boidinii]
MSSVKAEGEASAPAPAPAANPAVEPELEEDYTDDQGLNFNQIPHLNNLNWSPNYTDSINHNLSCLKSNYNQLAKLEVKFLKKFNSVYSVEKHKLFFESFLDEFDESLVNSFSTASSSVNSINALLQDVLMQLRFENDDSLKFFNLFNNEVLKPLRLFIDNYQTFIIKQKNFIINSYTNYEKYLKKILSLEPELNKLLEKLGDLKIKITNEEEVMKLYSAKPLPSVSPDTTDDNQPEEPVSKSADVPDDSVESAITNTTATSNSVKQIDPLSIEPFKSQYAKFLPAKNFLENEISFPLYLTTHLAFDDLPSFKRFIRFLDSLVVLSNAKVMFVTINDVFKTNQLVQTLSDYHFNGFTPDIHTIEKIINRLLELELVKPLNKLNNVFSAINGGYNFTIDDDIFIQWTDLFKSLLIYDVDSLNALIQNAEKNKEELDKKHAESSKAATAKTTQSASTTSKVPSTVQQQQSSQTGKPGSFFDMLKNATTKQQPKISLNELKSEYKKTLSVYNRRFEYFEKTDYGFLKQRQALELDIVSFNNNIEHKELDRVQIIYRCLLKFSQLLSYYHEESYNKFSRLNKKFENIREEDKVNEFYSTIWKSIDNRPGYYTSNVVHSNFINKLITKESTILDEGEMDIEKNVIFKRSIRLFNSDLSSLPKCTQSDFENDSGSVYATFKSLPSIVFTIINELDSKLNENFDEYSIKLKHFWLQSYNLNDVYKIRDIYNNILIREPNLSKSITDEKDINTIILNNFLNSIASEFQSEESDDIDNNNFYISKIILLLKIILIELPVSIITPLSKELIELSLSNSNIQYESLANSLSKLMDRSSLSSLIFIMKHISKLCANDDGFLFELVFNSNIGYIPFTHLIYRPVIFKDSNGNDATDSSLSGGLSASASKKAVSSAYSKFFSRVTDSNGGADEESDDDDGDAGLESDFNPNINGGVTEDFMLSIKNKSTAIKDGTLSKEHPKFSNGPFGNKSRISKNSLKPIVISDNTSDGFVSIPNDHSISLLEFLTSEITIEKLTVNLDELEKSFKRRSNIVSQNIQKHRISASSANNVSGSGSGGLDISDKVANDLKTFSLHKDDQNPYLNAKNAVSSKISGLKSSDVSSDDLSRKDSSGKGVDIMKHISHSRQNSTKISQEDAQEIKKENKPTSEEDKKDESKTVVESEVEKQAEDVDKDKLHVPPTSSDDVFVVGNDSEDVDDPEDTNKPADEEDAEENEDEEIPSSTSETTKKNKSKNKGKGKKK